MLDRASCPHQVNHLAWTDPKPGKWVRCKDCGELWIFDQVLAPELPGFAKRFAALVQALSGAPNAPTQPLSDLLAPELSLEALEAQLQADTAAVEALQQASMDKAA